MTKNNIVDKTPLDILSDVLMGFDITPIQCTKLVCWFRDNNNPEFQMQIFNYLYGWFQGKLFQMKRTK